MKTENKFVCLLLCLTIILSGFMSQNVQAQTKRTPYEKEVISILNENYPILLKHTQYLSSISGTKVKTSSIPSLKTIQGYTYEKLESEMGLLVADYEMLAYAYVFQLSMGKGGYALEKMSGEMTKAYEKCMKRCEKALTLKTKDEIERTEKRIKEKELDAEKKQLSKILVTRGIGNVMAQTRYEFLEIMKKGDFEKNAQFRQRVHEKGVDIFDSIAFKASQKVALECLFISYMRYDFDTLYSVWLVEDKYDAENEIAPFYIMCGKKRYMVAECKLDPQMAENVLYQRAKIWFDSVLNISIVNGVLMPSKVVMFAGSLGGYKKENWHATFVPYDKTAKIDSNISFSVIDAGVTDTIILQAIGGHVFDYNKYLGKILAEKARKELEARLAKEKKEMEEKLAKRLCEASEASLEYKDKSVLIKIDTSIKHLTRKITDTLGRDFKNEVGIELSYFNDWMERLLKKIRSNTRGWPIYMDLVEENNLQESDVERIEQMLRVFERGKKTLNVTKRYDGRPLLYGEKVDATNYYAKYKTISMATDQLLRYLSNYFTKINERGDVVYYTPTPIPIPIRGKNEYKVAIKDMMGDLKSLYHKGYLIIAQWIVDNDEKLSKKWNKKKEKYKDVGEFFEKCF